MVWTLIFMIEEIPAGASVEGPLQRGPAVWASVLLARERQGL